MDAPRETRTHDVLAIDAFHGGSHRQFLSDLIDRSHHRWTLVAGKSVHWKWRMRSAPLELAETARRVITSASYPDIVFCTDMLDLPQWRGLLRDARILTTPTVVYFHENQWTYPVAPGARPDMHFGYSNLLSALAADACWFNSQFHLVDFLEASRAFIKRMPDAHQAHNFQQLERKCQVLPPGFVARPIQASQTESPALTIGWVSRWEMDKRPDRFVEILDRLDQRGVDFRLVLLGPRPLETPDALRTIQTRYSDRIDHDGFAETADEYWGQLRRMDAVVSTADHEFFGIATCEAIWAGAIPVLPNRLSYPELAPSECLYESLEDAVLMLERLGRSEGSQQRLVERCRLAIEPFRVEETSARIDESIDRLLEHFQI